MRVRTDARVCATPSTQVCVIAVNRVFFFRFILEGPLLFGVGRALYRQTSCITNQHSEK